VISSAHTNSGILCKVMPGARMLNIVVMKLIDPKIDEAPARCSAKIAMSTLGPGLSLRSRERRIDSPADAGAGAHDRRADQQQPGRHEQPEADVVHARKGHVGARRS